MRDIRYPPRWYNRRGIAMRQLRLAVDRVISSGVDENNNSIGGFMVVATFNLAPDHVELQARAEKLANERHCPTKYENQRLGREFTTRRIKNDDGTVDKVPHLRGEFTTSYRNPPAWIGKDWPGYRWGRKLSKQSDNGAPYWSRSRRTNYTNEKWGYIAASDWAKVQAENVRIILDRCRECDSKD